MKILKNLTVKLLAVFTVLVLFAVIGAVGTAGVDKADAATPTTFEMCDGAELKVTSEGMRFKVRMDAATANEIKMNDNVSLIFLIAPSSYFDEVTENDKGIKDYYNGLRKKIEITANEDLIYESDGYYYANGCVVDIYEQNRGREYKCVAVKATARSKGTSFVYAKDGNNERCIYNLVKKSILNGESEIVEAIFEEYEWYGTEQYPIMIDDSAEFSSFLEAASDSENYANLTGKYYGIESSVKQSSAYSTATGNGGAISGFENQNNVSASYVVTFEDYDGSVMQSSCVRKNALVSYNSKTPYRKGHTFNGWRIGNQALPSSYAVTDNLTITAHYLANKYTLVFSGCEDREVTYGEPIGALPTAGWIANLSEWKIGKRVVDSDTVYDYDGNTVAQAATVYLALNKASDYTVVYPASATDYEKQAANMLVKHIKAITGITLPIRSEDVIEYNAETSKVISIGNTDLAAGVSTSALSHDGYLIKTTGKTIVLKAENDYSIVYAVSGYLEQLGVRFVSHDYTYYPSENYVAIGKYNVATSPDINYRVYAGGNESSEHSAELKMDGNVPWCDAYSEGYEDVHNTLSYVPTSLYYSTTSQRNSNYHMYSRTYESAKPTTVYELCWTDGINSSGNWDGTTSAFSIALESLKNFVRASSPDKEYFMFGQEDTPAVFCQCSVCKSRAKTYNVSGVYLIFANLLASKINEWAATEYPGRTIKVVIFSYLQSGTAPKNVTANENVYVWLAQINAKPFLNINDSNQYKDYKQAYVDGWKAACSHFFLWSYPAYIGNTFMYVPTIQCLNNDLAIYKEMGLEYVFMQGAHTSKGDWQAIMKSYVASKLTWDITKNAMTVRNEWIAGYFGPGATKVQECLDRMDNYFLNRTSLKAVVSSGSQNEGAWSPILSGWEESECRGELALLDEAIAAINNSGLSAEEKAIFNAHVRHVKLSPMAMLLYNNKLGDYEIKQFYDIYAENGVVNFNADFADNDIYYNCVSTRNVYIGLNETFDITKVSQRESGGSWILDGSYVDITDSSVSLNAGVHTLELLYKGGLYGRYSMTITVSNANGDSWGNVGWFMYTKNESIGRTLNMKAEMIQAARSKGNNYLKVTLNSQNGVWINTREGLGGGSWYSGDGKTTLILDLSGLSLSDPNADIWLFKSEFPAVVDSAYFIWYPVDGSINYAHNAYNRTGSAALYSGTSAGCTWTSAYDNKKILDDNGYSCFDQNDENAWKAFFKTPARETACISGDLLRTAAANGYEFVEIEYIALEGATELYYYSSPRATEILSSYFTSLPNAYRKAKFVNGRATITMSLKNLDAEARWLYLASSNGDTLIESVRFLTVSEVRGSAVTTISNGGNA